MALGRGLSELLGEVEVAYENNTQNSKNSIQELELELIKPNPYQPRKIFDEDKIVELKDSILRHGLLQPIVVTNSEDGYILVAGERRLRATTLANLSTIKAIVLDIEEKKLREYALIENIQRADLNVLEIAYSYNGLINEHNITHEELATMVQKSRSSITNVLRLLSLSIYTQQMISADKITFGHAKLIIGLEENEQKKVVDSIIGQKLSIRDTEKLIKESKNIKNNKKKLIKEKIQLDYTPLDEVLRELKQENLKVKINNGNFNISISSQADIKKILSYFNKNNLN